MYRFCNPLRASKCLIDRVAITLAVICFSTTLLSAQQGSAKPVENNPKPVEAPSKNDEAKKAAEAKAERGAKLKAAFETHPEDANARALWFIHHLRSNVNAAMRKELDQVMSQAGLSEESKLEYKKFEDRERIIGFNSELLSLMRGVRINDPELPAKVTKLRTRAYQLLKGGLVPPEPAREYMEYLLYATNGALDEKDKNQAMKGLSELKKVVPFVESLRTMVAELEVKVGGL